MSLYLDILALAAAVLVLLSVAGCTSNQPYRTSLIPCDTTQTNSNCAQAILESTPEYKLGFVEFDDQGWFWSREQLKAVESMIQEETQKTNKVIMVLFVHGWKNNAAFDNDNVKLVRTSLQVLNKAEQVQSQQQGRTPRKLIGIYAGWRGLSARLEPFKELSFWSRKQTAHKVGDGAMTELLVTLERLQQSSNHGLTAGAHGTEFIIIGHSFGGAAVYSAISQMVTERFVKTVEAGHPLKPLGDQVILLNPAFEGARHYNLNDLAISISQYPKNSGRYYRSSPPKAIGRRITPSRLGASSPRFSKTSVTISHNALQIWTPSVGSAPTLRTTWFMTPMRKLGSRAIPRWKRPRVDTNSMTIARWSSR